MSTKTVKLADWQMKWSQESGQLFKVYPERRRDTKMGKRRKFTDQFKAKIALEALRGDKTIQEIAAKHQVHPNQVSQWKRQAMEGMADVFARGGKSDKVSDAEVKELHAKIRRLAVENDFLAQGLKK